MTEIIATTIERDYKTLLEQADIIPTKQRLEIARILFSRAQHLSAEQLRALLQTHGIHVAKATVYNTLSLFARQGIIREVVVDPNRTFYDSNSDQHYHIYDENSGTLTDVYSDCLVTDALPALPANTELVGVDVIIRVRSTASTSA